MLHLIYLDLISGNINYTIQRMHYKKKSSFSGTNLKVDVTFTAIELFFKSFQLLYYFSAIGEYLRIKKSKNKTLRGTFIQSANNYLDELFYFGSLFVVKKKMQKKKTTITQIFNTIEAFNRAVMMQFYTAAFSKMYF